MCSGVEEMELNKSAIMGRENFFELGICAVTFRALEPKKARIENVTISAIVVK